jgi:hypothetical protein
MMKECALGVEIAEARDHVSIAAAGYIDAGFILVELAAHLDGTDPVAELLRLCSERTVVAVAPWTRAARPRPRWRRWRPPGST